MLEKLENMKKYLCEKVLVIEHDTGIYYFGYISWIDTKKKYLCVSGDDFFTRKYYGGADITLYTQNTAKYRECRRHDSVVDYIKNTIRNEKLSWDMYEKLYKTLTKKE